MTKELVSWLEQPDVDQIETLVEGIEIKDAFNEDAVYRMASLVMTLDFKVRGSWHLKKE
jgi:hypothetical protein